MGSKFGSIHIFTEKEVEAISILESMIEDIQVTSSSSGWTSIYGESLQWGTASPAAVKLSKNIHFPVLSVEYFDDDVLEIHLIQAGKKIASLIQGAALEGYGLRRKRLKVEKIQEVLNVSINDKELNWVCKELYFWELCDYLQLQFNLPFRAETVVNNLELPKTPWNTNLPTKPKGKSKDKKYEVSILRPGSLTMAMVTKDKELYTWGSKSYGVLGDKSIINRKKPEKILDNIVDVTMGSYSAYAINDKGKLIGWGEDSPHGTSMPKIMALTDVKEIGVRASDAYFLLNSGELYSYGQTWNGSDFVLLRSDVKSIHVTEYDAFAITITGELFGFGQNAYGQLGQMSDGKSDCLLRNVRTVDSDRYDVHAITDNGDLYIWRNEHKRGLENQVPKKEFEHVVQAVQSQDFVYAVTENGDLYAWGRSGAYISDSYYEERYAPTKLLEKVKKVVKTTYRIFVMFQNGEVCSFFVKRDQPGDDGYLTNMHASPLYRLGEGNRIIIGDKAAIEWLQKGRLHIKETELDFLPEWHMADSRIQDIVSVSSGIFGVDEAGIVWMVGTSTSIKMNKPTRVKIQEV
ncbi:hypothetical protein I6N90_13245 [Paenibacillus sp. GSMTC-2017]|uniref:RCC1 domain-containing protein n=1 Tax=Paenibacillus sp. GSMTC-2017 TaxID=2794350 RepID=UPI0018DA16C1|nr:hypothetical protein [Paenibacillus sp. GSMTC-2017]MBH5318766.1 hypothetical protein [Paenibacillus sp. GSMTC-2017]